jgi:hypothetical protein
MSYTGPPNEINSKTDTILNVVIIDAFLYILISPSRCLCN